MENTDETTKQEVTKRVPHACSEKCRGDEHACDKCGKLQRVMFFSGLPVLCSECLESRV